ncbi:MAG: cytochrome c biogenesis protein CcdA [Anaerorhabdus sp.]
MGIVIGLFVQGVLSFFSPCILPLLPIYIGYLTADAKEIDEEGKVSYQRKKVLFMTFSFVLGISCVFFLAGLSAAMLRSWLNNYSIIFTILGGMLLVFLGLFHLGVFSIPFLNQEKRIQVKNLKGLNGAKAFLLGFLFSFAWTPCIGPLLTSALVLAASAESAMLGNAYILAYTLGFIFSFMALGFFTEEILNLFKKRQDLLRWMVRVGGVIMLIMGGWMLRGSFKNILALQSSASSGSISSTETPTESAVAGKDIEEYDFSLEDQYGKTHTLSDYEGEPIIVTFFTTWCTYCKEEIQVLKSLVVEEGVRVFIITVPDYNGEGSKEEILAHIEENDLMELTFLFAEQPILMQYQVSGYPMSYIYKSDGYFLGYLPGAAEKEVFIDLIEKAK